MLMHLQFSGFTSEKALEWLRAFYQDASIVYRILDPVTAIPKSRFPAIFDGMGYLKVGLKKVMPPVSRVKILHFHHQSCC